MKEKKLKEDYKNFFNKLRKILNEIDPESLSPGKSGGAPISEYDHEVSQLINYIEHKMEDIKLNPILLVNYINQLWHKSFEHPCQKANEIVNQILSKLF